MTFLLLFPCGRKVGLWLPEICMFLNEAHFCPLLKVTLFLDFASACRQGQFRDSLVLLKLDQAECPEAGIRYKSQAQNNGVRFDL